MNMRNALSLTLAGSMLLLNSAAQTPAPLTPDPYRNFVGMWSGSILRSRTKMPSKVQVVISEKPDHKSMIWNYTFGEPNKEGYDRDVKVITFSKKWDIMTTQWKGRDKQSLSTSGLDQFARDGYGTFAATLLNESNLPTPPGGLPTSRMIVKLEPSKLTYVWETSSKQTTEIDSEFSFDRVPDPTAAHPTP